MAGLNKTGRRGTTVSRRFSLAEVAEALAYLEAVKLC
jgi:hypothetical protein